MLPPKDTDWLNGYKNKTHIYAVYILHSTGTYIQYLVINYNGKEYTYMYN